MQSILLYDDILYRWYAGKVKRPTKPYQRSEGKHFRVCGVATWISIPSNMFLEFEQNPRVYDCISRDQKKTECNVVSSNVEWCIAPNGKNYGSE